MGFVKEKCTPTNSALHGVGAILAVLLFIFGGIGVNYPTDKYCDCSRLRKVIYDASPALQCSALNISCNMITNEIIDANCNNIPDKESENYPSGSCVLGFILNSTILASASPSQCQPNFTPLDHVDINEQRNESIYAFSVFLLAFASLILLKMCLFTSYLFYKYKTTPEGEGTYNDQIEEQN